jgi:hypothetical protein
VRATDTTPTNAIALIARELPIIHVRVCKVTGSTGAISPATLSEDSLAPDQIAERDRTRARGG